MTAPDPETAQLGPSFDGTVMLDIGGDVGALIIHTTADLLLAELELERLDGEPAELHPVAGAAHAHTHADGSTHSHTLPHGLRTHVAVRERRGSNGVRYAAIYPGLREGDYTVFGVDGQPAATVTIEGGKVAQLDWR